MNPPLEIRFVRVVEWPGTQRESWQQRRAPFKASYKHTLDLLERELRHLNAKDTLLQTYHAAEDIRLDGWPRSNARVPARAGVILTFIKRDKKTLSFPCDRYNSWEDNLRAIALSLEGLRMVDRHGVTSRAEQYRGFEALPAPMPDEVPTVEEAAELLAGYSNMSGAAILRGLFSWRESLRIALLACHPDKPGGSTDAFRRVQAAKTVLEAHFGGR